MANPWFRMYSEFASDPKVQMLSEPMQRRLVMLFCMRCSDVTVTLSDEEMAFHLRISVEELAQTKALFIDKGFIDSAWNISNWDKRQRPSDTSAARTREYRERMREVTVTSHVTERDALDKKRIEDKKKPTSSAAPSDPVADRLAAVTGEAVNAYNSSSLTKSSGGNLPNVSASIGREKRQGQVRRCLRVARQICEEKTGSQKVTPEFWGAYFDLVAQDDFYSGRTKGGHGHQNYVPDFELLTREDTMLRIYDKLVGTA